MFGDKDDIGLADDERDLLEKCPSVTVTTISDAGHFTLNEKPGEVARILLEALEGG